MASETTRAALLAKARGLRNLCDPECEGRCVACPRDVVDELVDALAQQPEAAGAQAPTRAQVENLKRTYQPDDYQEAALAGEWNDAIDAVLALYAAQETPK